MFNNVVLDVFIGLIFIFLLYSLLATIVQEIIARWFNLRARMLQKAIRRMLEDGDKKYNNYFLDSSVASLFVVFIDSVARFFYPIRNEEKLIQKFYDHPGVKYLGEDKLFSKPSYLHSHNFSQTILQLLRGDTFDGRTESESSLVRQALENNTLQLNPETLRQFKLLFYDARQDSYLFKKKLEDWFDETMERSSGWYKKQTQSILIIIGLAFAASFNVDAIAISKILMKDKNAREQIVQLAISRQKEYAVILDTLSKTTTIQKEIKGNEDTLTTITDVIVKVRPSDSYIDTAYKQLTNDASLVQGILGLNGISASSDSLECKRLASYYDSLAAKETTVEKKRKLLKLKEQMSQSCYEANSSSSPYQTSNFLKWVGWMITALAISLGAPFWFDLLNKFVKLRTTGPKPTGTSLYDKPGNTPLINNPVSDVNNNEIRG